MKKKVVTLLIMLLICVFCQNAYASVFYNANSSGRPETININTAFTVPAGMNVFRIYSEGTVGYESIGFYRANLNVSSSLHNYVYDYADGDAGSPADETRSDESFFSVTPGEVLNINGYIHASNDTDGWTTFYIELSSFSSGTGPPPVNPVDPSDPPIVYNPVFSGELTGGGTAVYGNELGFYVSGSWSGGNPNPNVTGVELYTADGTRIVSGGLGAISCTVPIPANQINKTYGPHSYTTEVYAMVYSDNSTSHKTNSVPVTITYDVTPSISFSPVSNTSIHYGDAITTNLTAAYDLAHLPFAPLITKVEIKEASGYEDVIGSAVPNASSVNRNFTWTPKLVEDQIDKSKGKHNYRTTINAIVYTNTGKDYITVSIPIDVAYRINILFDDDMKEKKSQILAVEDMNKKYIKDANNLPQQIKSKLIKPSLSETLRQKIIFL